jgi:hypothetical protein
MHVYAGRSFQTRKGNPVSDERKQRSPKNEAEEHAESKSDEEREREQEWSQGGQDVEEAQHQEPTSEQ